MTHTSLTLKYRRVLLKVSGEFFSGEQGSIDPRRVRVLAGHLQELSHLGVQVAVVLGAGNFCRGKVFAEAGFDQVSSDHIGMLATVMNALALRDTLSQMNISTEVRSAFAVERIVLPFFREEGLRLLDAGNILICAGGTGNPLVTTDTTAALRAIELKADVLLKATKVDGVYSADPHKEPNAVLFSRLTYQEVIEKQLQIMDLSAFSMVQDHQVPVRIFNMDKENVFKRIVLGEEEGSLVYTGE